LFKPINQYASGKHRARHSRFSANAKKITLTSHPYDSLFIGESVCVTCTGNSRVTNHLTLDYFLSMGYISVCFDHNVPSYIDQVLTKEHNLSLKIEMVINTFSQVPHYLVATNRIAIIHRRIVEHWAKFLPLKIMPVPVPIEKTEWCL